MDRTESCASTIVATYGPSNRALIIQWQSRSPAVALHSSSCLIFTFFLFLDIFVHNLVNVRCLPDDGSVFAENGNPDASPLWVTCAPFFHTLIAKTWRQLQYCVAGGFHFSQAQPLEVALRLLLGMSLCSVCGNYHFLSYHLDTWEQEQIQASPSGPTVEVGAPVEARWLRKHLPLLWISSSPAHTPYF